MNNNIVEFLNSKDKVELSSQVVELADVQSFIKKVDVAEKSLDKKTPGKLKAKDGLLSYKNAAKEAMYNFDAVMAEYDAIVEAAKMYGLEVPANLKANYDRAKFLSGSLKQEFNLADNLLNQLNK